MKTFYIITNKIKDKDMEVTRRIQDYILESGNQCVLAEQDCEGVILPESVPEEVDYAIVLGGDGSIIQAARGLLGLDVPMLGVNMGTLGYLAEVEVSELDESLKALVEGRFFVEDRMMLRGEMNQDISDAALNDIVVSREGTMRISHFKIFVNGELLNNYQADGVIISTPTGSTGYNLSAGGPIVEPTAGMLVITPICSHALNASSVVLSVDDCVELEVGEGRYGMEHSALFFDGRRMASMVTGDRVKICRAAEKTRLIKLNRESFLKTLREKMKGN